ncbi:MAG: phage antirepressor KilAC domain-containing protein [Allobaculum sp.]|uniref:phage antirepressor KilAC domain-containing protein n=1 Tax=Allobaculum sp. TaxID=1872463 RepID=UPI00399C0613
MNEIQNFVFDGSQIRTLTIDDEPYFVGKDVAVVLGYRDTADALKKHVDDEDKLTRQFADSGQRREMKVINESGLYSLILGSKLPDAKRFKRWVTSEVLPQIRKHGAYATDATIDRILGDPDFGIRLLQDLKAEREARKALEVQNAVQTQQIAELQPKASYYDVVLNCKDLLSVSKIAKDFGKSGRWLNDFLHEKGIQFKQGSVWLLYQKYAAEGYTQTKTDPYTGSDGMIHSKVRTCWTQKGRLFIYDLLKSNGILPTIEREDVGS